MKRELGRILLSVFYVLLILVGALAIDVVINLVIKFSSMALLILLFCLVAVIVYCSFKENGKSSRRCEKCEGMLMHVPYKSTPLLSITLDDIDSVPIVHYKGEEIKEKVRVSFDWKTTDDNCTYPTYILLEHVDKPIRLGFNTKTIQHNHPIEEG